METISYRDAITLSMRDAMRKNPRALVYGLGVTDFTGIFGTTLGLEKEFGSERVFDTPLAEESMTGFAVGAALNGLYPIHIHIRTDFMLLAMNQIVNSIAKYKYMYGGLFKLPMLIRAVIGRSWGQGAQHSQSLQALFSHIPGLTVIMPSSARAVLDAYDHAVNRYKAPVISLEHRALYDCTFNVSEKRNSTPLSSHLVRKGRDVTIVATSIMVVDAIHAARFVKEKEGLDVEIIDLNCLTHPNREMILSSVKKTGRLIVADTGWAPFGVCAEVSRLIATTAPGILKAPIMEISMAHSPCPTAKTLENYFYPDMGAIVNDIYRLIFKKRAGKKELPSEEYKKRLYKEFKGPF
ncbi:MAG: hypothetical protein A2270_11035 [Elusimicrobia bacterium RIFOXYA12_FULL_51_18]|nr:MAG: hypothetical protein A2270_11035 [Elusimicrobia bacterium RIFOXYA12_FULL_51_18]OGS32314.1 MAG: hypothetical protein A2218_02875 [Elusimicrobia bacterium RIFOXYA2_FULL_53_38]